MESGSNWSLALTWAVLFFGPTLVTVAVIASVALAALVDAADGPDARVVVVGALAGRGADEGQAGGQQVGQRDVVGRVGAGVG